MSTRGSATRYARALLDVAIKESIAERAERDLTSFGDLVAQHPQLERALTHPAIPTARKRALTEDLTSRLELSTPVAKLLRMLAERDRLSLVPDLVEVYRERLMDHQRVVRAEVTTAAPLPAGRDRELQERLSRATGRQVLLSTRVDPAIIGGMVARIGSVVYDGSIAAQLLKMRERLAAQS
jgi:F-type H+-transporting ATPase subunit delta